MLLLLCLSMISCGDKANNNETLQPVKVKVQKVKASPTSDFRNFSGTVEENSGSSLSFSVPGTLNWIHVIVGQRVNKGTLLASIDPVSLKSNYDAAKATLDQAQDACNRMRELHDKGSLPEIKWVEVQSKLQQAVTMEEIARKNLNDSKLYSPFNGVISEKFVETGQNVLPGTPVLKLSTVNKVKIKIAVPESEISNVHINQTADVKVTALNGRSFEGVVVEKGIAANPLSHSYDVKLLIDNPNTSLMPGMVTQVTLNNKNINPKFIIPAQLVQLDENNHSFLWINTNGKAEKCIIECGKYCNQGVEIIAGLKEHDEIIVEGQQKVSIGSTITTN